jgi:hypothetical protein
MLFSCADIMHQALQDAQRRVVVFTPILRYSGTPTPRPFLVAAPPRCGPLCGSFFHRVQDFCTEDREDHKDDYRIKRRRSERLRKSSDMLTKSIKKVLWKTVLANDRFCFHKMKLSIPDGLSAASFNHHQCLRARRYSDAPKLRPSWLRLRRAANRDFLSRLQRWGSILASVPGPRFAQPRL